MTVPCRVAGDPSIITFEWTFANSGERFDVTASAGNGVLTISGASSNSNGNNNAIGDNELGIGDGIVSKQHQHGGGAPTGSAANAGVLDYGDNNSNGMLKFALSCSNRPNKLPRTIASAVSCRRADGGGRGNVLCFQMVDCASATASTAAVNDRPPTSVTIVVSLSPLLCVRVLLCSLCATLTTIVSVQHGRRSETKQAAGATRRRFVSTWKHSLL